MPSDFNQFWLVFVGVLGVIGTIYTLYSNIQRNKNERTKEAVLDAKVITVLENNVEHIRRNTDELRVEHREQGRQQSEKLDKFVEKMNEKHNELAKDLLSLRSDFQTHVELQVKHDKMVDKRFSELEKTIKNS
jgi:hypothetical protein